MDKEDTLITEQEKADRAADIITAQPVVVKCGETEYILTPRTPHQLRAITKYLAEYNKEMAGSLIGIIKGNEDEGAAEKKINNEAIDSMIVLVQMLLDQNKTFNAKKPTIKKSEIENDMDFGQINHVIRTAGNMHDVRDIISQMQRLRVI